jgi:replicative DNA helicase
MIDKLPPLNIEVEENILGGVLLDPHAILRVVDILSPEAFYIESHQVIYQAILDLYAQQKPTDMLAVSSWLKDHKLLKKTGGEAKLVQLLERTVSAVNIDHLAHLVQEKYQRRQLIATTQSITDLAYDTTTPIDSVLEQAEEKIFNISTNKADRFKPETIESCLIDVFNQLGQDSPPLYPTGLRDLDGMIGGMVKQDLIVIGARASMGKTWLGCYLANYIAANQQQPVVFFSAEMSKSQLTKRFLAMHSGIDSQRLIRNEVYEHEYEALIAGLEKLKQLPLIIDDTPASIQNPSRMRSVLRRVKSERGGLGLVVMDYIQKLGDRAAGNRAQAVGKLSGAFKDIAKEFDVPFVALAQVNRGVESQSNKRPGMADIKDSGDIEQDMDVGLLLYREEYYDAQTEARGLMEINVAKNRNGATGTCQVTFEPTVGTFNDKEKISQTDYGRL